MKRGKLSEEIVNSDSDYETLSSQDNKNSHGQEKTKKKNKTVKLEENESTSTSTSNDNKSFELSGKRKVTVQKYRTSILVDIREYYEDKASGLERPGSKGISLTKEQYEKFKELIPEIDAALKKIN